MKSITITSPDTLRYALVDSPIGRLTLIADDAAIVEVRFANAPLVDGHGLRHEPDHPVLAAAADQLDEYFAGERVDFDLPLDPHGTEFQRLAWNALTTIPYGETVSYGEQARRIGDANKARAVGAANGRNPIPVIIPCHRVVGSNGHLTGFGGGIESKAWLLDHEQSVARKA